MTDSKSAEPTGSTETLSSRALGNFNDISDAYSTMTVRNVTTFTDAITAIASAKNPGEVLVIQQKFAKESMETAVETGRKVGGFMSSALMSASPKVGWLSPSV